MGCTGSSALSQVSLDAHRSCESQKKQAPALGGGKPCTPATLVLEKGGGAPAVAVVTQGLPSGGNAGAPDVQDPALPGAVASPRGAAPEQPAEVGEAPVAPPAIAVAAAAAAAAAAEAAEAAEAAGAAVSVPEAVPKEVAATAPALRLVPVQVSEDEIAAVLQEYSERLPPRLARALDCSWQHIEAETAKARTGTGGGLEWYWLGAEGEETVGATVAWGLVAFRIARTMSASHGQVCHLSIASESWHEMFPAVLSALRSHMFSALPIASIRVSLWYADQEDGAYSLDRDMEGAFKEAGFRWFSLTNTSDGRRGQIMALRRSEETDPPLPEEEVDVALASCLLLPYTVELAVAEEPDAAASGELPTGNALLMAECLRRHALQQRERSLGEDASAADASSGATEAGDAEGPAAAVAELYERLGRRGPLALVRSADPADAEGRAAFVLECLGTESAPELLAAPPEAVAAQRALCGGLVLRVNWRECRVDPAEPAWAHVPVHATGQLAGTDGPQPVAYLATQDDDTFVTVWALPPDLRDAAHGELYDHCRRVVREAPPSAGDAQLAEVALPRFRIRAQAAASVPRTLAQAHGFRHPRELLVAQVAARQPRPGALRRRDQSPSGQVLQLDGHFLFCVWNTKLDDLEAPLFATVVGPNDWSLPP